MIRVSAHVPAAALVSLMLIAATGVAAQASFDPDPNPNNHGHHYGWYKHNHNPAPAPNPNPTPPPVPTPGHGNNPGSNTNPVTGGTHGSGNPAPNSAPNSSPASFGTLLTALQGLNVALLQLVPTGQTANGQIGLLPQNPANDPLWWLILLLVPTLAALWFIALRGVLRGNGAGKTANAARAVPAGSRAQ